MNGIEFIKQVNELKPILEGADHIDVKTVEGDVPLNRFIASMLGYMPWWLKILYSLRAPLVRVLGMKQETIPFPSDIKPEDVSFTKGEAAFFFTVAIAEKERFWFAEASDKHLSAHLGCAVEPLEGGRRRYHVATIVHYRNWAGPVYFNIIRPFHHLVVRSMARAGVRQRVGDSG